MNLANKLTMARVIMIPVYLALWAVNAPWNRYAALGVFVLASLTDMVDGYVARKYQMITDFGKFMDPLADKVLVLTAMIVFCAQGIFPAWALVVVIFREFAVSGMRLIAAEGGKVIAAGWSGKVKTASTMVCLCLLHFQVPAVLVTVCVWVIVVTTVYSGIEYFAKNKDVIPLDKI